MNSCWNCWREGKSGDINKCLDVVAAMGAESGGGNCTFIITSHTVIAKDLATVKILLGPLDSNLLEFSCSEVMKNKRVGVPCIVFIQNYVVTVTSESCHKLSSSAS